MLACQRRPRSTPTDFSRSSPASATSHASCTKRLPPRRSSRRTATSRRACCSTTSRFADPADALHHARPLRHPPAVAAGASSRRPGARPGARRRPARGLAAPSASTGTCSPAPPRATGSRTSSPTLFGITDELDAENADASTTAIDARLADPDFTPRALFETLPHRGARDHRRPAGRPRRRTRSRGRPWLRRAGAPDVPARRVPRPRGRRVPRACRPRCSMPRAAPTTSPATWRRSRNAGRTSSATAPSRPTTACASRTRSNSTPTRPPRCSAVRWPALSTRRSAPLPRPHAVRMARMSVADGLVMTVHPGVRRNHHRPTFERFGADTGHDIPVAHRRTPRTCVPCSSASASSPASTSCCSPSTRPCTPARSRRSPGSTRASTSAPRGGSSTHPTPILRFRSAVTETAGFYRVERLHRRHPGVPLHPGAARHRAPARRVLPRPARARGTRQPPAPRDRIARDLVDAIPREVFKL